MQIKFIIYLLPIVGILLIATTVLLRNSQNKVNRSFAFLDLSIVGWLLSLFVADTVSSESVALLALRIGLAVSVLMAFLFLLFSFIFTHQKLPNYIKYVANLLLLVFVPLSLTPIIVPSVSIGETGAQIGEVTLFYTLHTLVLALFFIVGLVTIYRYRRSANGLEKQQIRLLTIAILFAFITNVVTGFILELLDFVGAGNLVGTFSLFIFSAITAYAIVKHKLFDIRLVVARLLGYLLSIGALAVLYALISFGITNMILPDNVSQNVLRGTYTVLAVVLAFTFQPQKKFFDRLSNKIFYQDAYDAQALLDELNAVLVSAIDLQKILSDSSEVINRSLKSDFIVFSIKNKDKSPQRLVGSATKEFNGQDLSKVSDMIVLRGGKTVVADQLNENQSDISGLMRQNDIAVIVRITDDPTSKDADIGYMVLGNKKSGSPFSGQDIKVLEIIADELVIAIQNALRFEEIKNFNITLQEKVDDATKKLRDANKRLIELDQTKDDFISMASHQLRTPLTSIKGYVSMVMEGDAGKITKKQSDLLGQSFNSAQRMVYLIADLLNVSRLRTGKFVIEAKKTNLAEVIDGEMAQLKETAKARNLELTYKKPTGFPELMLDETKIRQVIMNFIDNAIYYTPKEGHITVNLEDKGENIEFTVVDDGIGVPKTVQHNLFNKFYRADNAKKARPDGTGLGLFMAKKVVVAQGGSIIFKSTEGKGSTFGFSFNKKPILPENFKGVTKEADK